MRLGISPKRWIECVRYRIRLSLLKRRNIPRRWLSPGELLRQDLSYYEPGDKLKIDGAFIVDFAKARDETLSIIKKQTAFTLIVFVFLASSYLGSGLSFSILGISLKEAPGVAEGLLLAANLIGCYTLVLQGNVYLLVNAIKFAIGTAIPEELRQLYLIRYFPHEQFGLYYPFNTPFMVQNAATRGLVRATAGLFLVLLFVVSVAFILCNFGLLYYYLVANPKLGIWSYTIFGFVVACGISSFMYMILTRLRLPYLDYSINHELEVLQQVNPAEWRRRGGEVFKEIIDLENEMREKGYLR